jgi:hypothetical protein
MSWFKVDDKFHSHPKVKGLKAVDPLGLWLLCGSYGSDHPKLDGRVSIEVAADFCANASKARKFAAELVRRGLWEADGDGWRFHDWIEYQPSADEVSERRAALSEKRSIAGRKGAAKRWQAPLATDGKSASQKSFSYDSKLASDSPDPVPIPSRPDPTPFAPRPAEGELGDPAAETPSEPPPEALQPPLSSPRERDAGIGGNECGAWIEGIRRATGNPQTPLPWTERSRIAEVLFTHAPELRNHDAEEWITACAEAYARDTIARRTMVNLSVRDWVSWMRTTPWKRSRPAPPKPAPPIKIDPEARKLRIAAALAVAPLVATTASDVVPERSSGVRFAVLPIDPDPEPGEKTGAR